MILFDEAIVPHYMAPLRLVTLRCTRLLSHSTGLDTEAFQSNVKLTSFEIVRWPRRWTSELVAPMLLILFHPAPLTKILYIEQINSDNTCIMEVVDEN